MTAIQSKKKASVDFNTLDYTDENINALNTDRDLNGKEIFPQILAVMTQQTVTFFLVKLLKCLLS